MSGFDVRWLDLREPYDSAARDESLERALAGSIVAGGPIVDLGAGTGANLRHLAPRLAADGPWILVDHDPTLLAQARSRHARACGAGARPDVAVRTLDLARDLDGLDLAEAALITASALLDLVSRDWLGALVARCARARVPALLALSYDGRIEWSEPEDADEEVAALVNAHQRGDKGFGPALGPAAVAAAVEGFEARGYAVRTATSDWLLGPHDRALQRALLDGWVEAAVAMAPRRGDAIRAWRTRRLGRLAAGMSGLRVGHADLLALPP